MGRRRRSQPGWMRLDALQQFYDLGFSYADIAHANEEATGWHPSASAVSRKLHGSMGLPKRHASHRELIPWHVNPRHKHDQIYYALQAESRGRQQIPLSSQDFYRARWLRDLLTRDGIARVVDYDYKTGWTIVPAEKTDADIIRQPASDAARVRRTLPAEPDDDYDEDADPLAAVADPEVAAYMRDLITRRDSRRNGEDG